MPTGSPPGSVELLDGALAWTCGRLQLARTSPSGVVTPCRDWDLGQLLVHLDESVGALGEAAELGRVPLEPPAEQREVDLLVDRIVQRVRRTRAGWQRRVTSAPVWVGDLPLGRDAIAEVGALEIAVHGWDVAAAAGRPVPLPEDLAEQLCAVARLVVTPDERRRRFAPTVPVAPSATASTRLLAHLGRRAA